MANPEHLEILKQGVEVWNEWRIDNRLVRPDLSDANIVELFFDDRNSNSKFRFTHPQRVNLGMINFIRANLSGANFTLIDMWNPLFRSAILDGATFFRAELNAADLSMASVNETDFSHARISAVRFADNDLSTVKGLETVEHLSSSTIGIDTLYKSRGKIPEVFLRGCGVPESFIVQIPALIASLSPVQFYKCFISFTEADDLFSERLYNDLQGAGVRCWRWKEDATWGKTLVYSIDEAVRIYDKLILICSEQSLNAPAVIREIERALQKEDELARQGKDSEVLFPIRLDDYIFTGWNHHRKADVIAKNVGDFRQWHEPEKYKKAFERLLRDLKAEEKKV